MFGRSKKEVQEDIIDTLEEIAASFESIKDTPLPHFEFDIGMLPLEQVLQELTNEAYQGNFSTDSARYFCYVIQDISSKLSPEQLQKSIEEVHALTLLSAELLSSK